MDLREARQSRSLTQKELEVLTGLSNIAISLIETGKTVPNADTRRRLEKVLGCRINWLALKGNRKFSKCLNWERVEGNFRKVIFDMNVLPRKQQIEFIQVAHKYLKEFETVLTAGGK